MTTTFARAVRVIAHSRGHGGRSHGHDRRGPVAGWRCAAGRLRSSQRRDSRHRPRRALKRPRFHVHFTPTYGSWLNLVERWFAVLTTKQLRRWTHRSVAQLEPTIRDFIDAHHADPKPFIWT